MSRAGGGTILLFWRCALFVLGFLSDGVVGVELLVVVVLVHVEERCDKLVC